MTKIITYQGSMDALVWHKEYKNLESDAELVVPVAHEAVFIKNGQATDCLPFGRYLLSETCIGQGHLFSSATEKTDCRVYYVKKEGAYAIKWNTPEALRIKDPLLKIPVEIDLSGVFSIKLIDSKKFLTRLLANTQKASLEEVKEFFRNRMLGYLKDQLLVALAENKISTIELPRRLMSISKDLELRTRYIFEDYGVSIEGFMLKKTQLLSGGEDCAFVSVPPFAVVENKKAAQTATAVEVMYCPECAVDLPPLSVYCFKCGAKVQH